MYDRMEERDQLERINLSVKRDDLIVRKGVDVLVYFR